MEHIRDLMRAAAADPPPARLTSAGLAAAGDRGLRLRRYAAMGGAAFAVTAVAVSLAALPALRSGGTPPAGSAADGGYRPVPPAPRMSTPPPPPEEPSPEAIKRLSEALKTTVKAQLPNAQYVPVKNVGPPGARDALTFYRSQAGYKAHTEIVDKAGRGDLFVAVMPAYPNLAPPAPSRGTPPPSVRVPQTPGVGPEAPTARSVPPLATKTAPRDTPRYLPEPPGSPSQRPGVSPKCPATSTCRVVTGPNGERVEVVEERLGKVITYRVSVVKEDGTSVSAIAENISANYSREVPQRPTPPLTVDQLVTIVCTPGLTLRP